MMKLVAIAAVTLSLSVGFIGCGLLDPLQSTNPTVTLSVPDTLQTGTTTPITGKIDAPENITSVSFKILNSSGTTASNVTVSGPSISGVDNYKFEGSLLTITVGASAASGSYDLKVSVTAGSTSDVLFPFYVKGGSSPSLTTGTVTLGGHSNTTGSSVDLDDGTVMVAATATQAGSGADIVYTYSGVANSPVLMTPVYAAETSGITAFSGWVSPNNTPFHKVTADFDAITTAAEIQALFNAASVSSTGRLSVSANDVIVVKTDENNYVLIRMETVSSDATGTATVKYARE